VRGFVRNYARLLHLDPDAVVAALPGVSTPSLDSPALHPTAPTMGELPATERSKPGWTPLGHTADPDRRHFGAAVYDTCASTAKQSACRARPRHRGSRATGDRVIATGRPVRRESGSRRASRQPACGSDRAPPPARARARCPALRPAMAPEIAAEPAGSTTLVLTFRGPSWTDVKDRTGSLLSQMNPAGQTQTLKGTPPFDLVIGNAYAVSLTYRGAAVDLAPHHSEGRSAPVAGMTRPS